MVSQNPTVKHYLEQFRANLTRVPEHERYDLVREIENHIAEAVEAGHSVADVLQKLGPADRLAKAYSAESLLKQQPSSGGSASRWFAVLGVLALTSLPSLIIIPLLTGIGIGFTLGGIGSVIAGVVALFMPWLVVTPWPLPYGMPQVGVIIIGVVMACVGALALWGLVAYVRLILSTMRKVWTTTA